MKVNIKNIKWKVLLGVVLLVAVFAVQMTTSLSGVASNLKFAHESSRYMAFDKYYNTPAYYTPATLGGVRGYCLDYQRETPGSNLSYIREISPKTTAAIIYGYPNKSIAELGVADENEAIFATQYAVWILAQESGDNITENPLYTNIDNLVAREGYEAKFNRSIAAANKIIAQARSNPYKANPVAGFDTASAKVTNDGQNIVAGPYRVSVSDANVSSIYVYLTNAPASAKITDANGNVKNNFKENEDIYVRLSSYEAASTLKLNAKISAEKYVGAMYGDSQKLTQNFAVVTTEPVELAASVDISWTSIFGSIEVLKVDQNNDKIVGVEFELRDSNGTVVAKDVTDENGVVRFNGIKEGKYTLVETKAPDGYVMGNEPIQITVETGKVFKLTVENKKIQGGIKIIKKNQYNEPIEGVKFEILDSNKNVVQTITTNSNGEATVSNLSLGKYYYREVEAPENVTMDTNTYEFKVETDGQIIEKVVINNVTNGFLKIIKVDEYNKPLEGVKFQILNSDKKVIETVTTDKDGIARTKELTRGKYYYREVSVPQNNIIVDNNIYEFDMNGTVIEKTVVNKYVKGSLKIVKVDEYNKPLEGVKFQILNADKKVIETVTTNKDGIAEVNNLIKGTYYYKEVEAPENVVMDTNEYKFEINTQNQVVVKNIVNKLVKGSLKIIKVDEYNKPLEGVTFEILNEQKQVVDTITTDKNGVAQSKELQNGKYYYREVKVPDNIVLDNTLYEFDMNGVVVEKTVVNKYVKGTIKIIKVDENETPIEGVKFEILNESKEVVDTITTNKDGIAESKELIKGIYYYREVEAPDNVIIDKNEYKFEITTNNQVVIKNIVNKLVKGSLKIVKVDEFNKPLEGVTFEILDANKNVIDKITTNDSGIAVSDKLQKGTYYYREVKAPDNIVIDNNIYEFKIEEENQIVVKNIVNNYKKGKIEIYKIDKEDKKPISGVKFEILNESKEVVDTITTDKDGIAVSKDLIVGKYYYREVEAPSIYVIDSNEYSFDLNENNEIVKKTVENEKVLGRLQILKLDKDTKQPLEGVKFQILNEQKQVVDEIVTNKDGIATTKYLQKGVYYYKEISAPEHYIFSDEEVKFEITKNEELLEKTVYNEKEKLPVTGGFISTDMLITFIVTVISVLGYVTFKVVTKKSNI